MQIENPVTSIIIQVVVLLVAVVVGFLVAEYRRFKKMLDDKVSITPEWVWMAESLARIGVRAAYQMFDQVDKRFPYVAEWLVGELAKHGYVMDEEKSKTITIVIEAAWAEFKAELQKSGVLPAPTGAR